MNRLKELDRNDLRRHGKDVTLHKAISHPFWLIGAIELSKINKKTQPAAPISPAS
jgi:hypothetical protein